MEKTTQKLVIIAVICAILLIALQLFDGLVHDRAHYADIAQQNVATQADAYQARATLGNRLDLYRLTERSSKYAVLFLLITFGGCFLFETLRGLRVHPVQYTLVGAAICIFYLLLLSLGEHIGFTAAYLAHAAPPPSARCCLPPTPSFISCCSRRNTPCSSAACCSSPRSLG